MFFSLACSHYLSFPSLSSLPSPLAHSLLSLSLPSGSHQRGPLSFPLSWLSFPKLSIVSPWERKGDSGNRCPQRASPVWEPVPKQGLLPCSLHPFIPQGSRGWSLGTLGTGAHRGRQVSPADVPPCWNHWLLSLFTDPPPLSSPSTSIHLSGTPKIAERVSTNTFYQNKSQRKNLCLSLRKQGLGSKV